MFIRKKEKYNVLIALYDIVDYMTYLYTTYYQTIHRDLDIDLDHKTPPREYHSYHNMVHILQYVTYGATCTHTLNP